MTTLTQPATTTRFRYTDNDDVIYVGEVEISEDDEITFLSVWSYGMTVEECFPYDKRFPIILRRQLEQAALEARTTPPAVPVELPTDWEEIEILDTVTTYTIAAKSAALPNVKTDADIAVFGLSAVRRIVPVVHGYLVTARGGIEDMRRELHRIRLF